MPKNSGRGSSLSVLPSRKMFVPNTLPNFHFINDREVALDSAMKWVGERQTFMVPRGFVTDFASVPKFLWWLFGPTGAYTAAAILHDYLCKILWMRHPPVTGRETDGIFRRRCKELGVSYVTRWMLWTGVRWGALFNERRRAEWWKDAPLVGLWSLLALAPVLIATLGVCVGLTLVWILSAFARMVRLA